MTATPSTGADGIPKSLPSRSRSGQPLRRVFNGTPAVESGDDEFLTTNRGLVLDPDQRPKCVFSAIGRRWQGAKGSRETARATKRVGLGSKGTTPTANAKRAILVLWRTTSYGSARKLIESAQKGWN